MSKKNADKIVGLICPVCKAQNYVTFRNKINLETKGTKGVKLELKKYCKKCRKVTLHKETSKLK